MQRQCRPVGVMEGGGASARQPFEHTLLEVIIVAELIVALGCPRAKAEAGKVMPARPIHVLSRLEAQLANGICVHPSGPVVSAKLSNICRWGLHGCGAGKVERSKLDSPLTVPSPGCGKKRHRAGSPRPSASPLDRRPAGLRCPPCSMNRVPSSCCIPAHRCVRPCQWCSN